MREKNIQTINWDTKEQTEIDVTEAYYKICQKLKIKEFNELSYDETKKALQLMLDEYQVKTITLRELGGLADCLLGEAKLMNGDDDEYLEIVTLMSDIGFDLDTLPEAVPETIQRATDYLAK